jgi:hypothetical protein
MPRRGPRRPTAAISLFIIHIRAFRPDGCTARAADVHTQQKYLLHGSSRLWLEAYRFARNLPTSAAVIDEGWAPKRAMT